MLEKEKLIYFDSMIAVGEHLYKDIKVRFNGLCICTCGECKLLLNGREFLFKKYDVLLMLPEFKVRSVEASDDFQLAYFGVDSLFLGSIYSEPSFFYVIYSTPIVRAPYKLYNRLLQLCGLVQSVFKDKWSSNYYFDFVGSLVRSVYSLLHMIYELSNDTRSSKETGLRRDMLNRYIELLDKEYAQHREVTYYASKLCVTPKYFSHVIKEQSQRSAIQWIHIVTVGHIKRLLISTTLQIQQISDQLNFSSVSAFVQYFKTHSGFTPNEFRKKFLL